MMGRLNTNPSLKITGIREEFDELIDGSIVNFDNVKNGHFLIIKRDEDLYLALKISETSVFSFKTLTLTEIDSNVVLCYNTETEIIITDHLPDNTTVASCAINPGELTLNDALELVMGLTENDPNNCRYSIRNFTKNNLEDIKEIRSYHLYL